MEEGGLPRFGARDTIPNRTLQDVPPDSVLSSRSLSLPVKNCHSLFPYDRLEPLGSPPIPFSWSHY